MSRRVVLGSKRAPPAADPSFQATEIAHLKMMVATLEIRLAQQNTILEESRTNEIRCERCADAKRNEDALYAENERLWNSRGELVARLKKLNDDAFAKAFVERHAAEVLGRRVRK